MTSRFSISPDLKKLGDELTRRKDGQFVFGRRVDAKDSVRLSGKEVEKLAVDTFKPLAPLFRLYEPRIARIQSA